MALNCYVTLDAKGNMTMSQTMRPSATPATNNVPTQ